MNKATILYTILALIAFAANSILGRLALAEQTIDASSFTIIRLFSGALMLLILLKLNQPKKTTQQQGSWRGAGALFLYAITFSWAYVSLQTGTGALILFGSVQLTIILLSLFSGTRLKWSEWGGVLLAFAGFVYLILPGVSAPSPIGFVLMSIAGMGWGVYTLIGRTSTAPLADTAFNFARTIPFLGLTLLLVLLTQTGQLSRQGVLLAIASGAITSGIGYAMWYQALRGLTAVQSGVVQLLVPVIAALGGILFVGEILSTRLIIASIMILGGILLVVLARRR